MPDENRLAGASSFDDVNRVLTATRGGVAWECLGHAMACYEIALTYAQQREQFGQPIAGFQLVQMKLAEMLTAVTHLQLLCFRMAELQEQGRLTAAMASMAKLTSARMARQVTFDARDVLGGNGAPAGVPRGPAPDRHGGRLHLRGHRLDAGADPGSRGRRAMSAFT